MLVHCKSWRKGKGNELVFITAVGVVCPISMQGDKTLEYIHIATTIAEDGIKSRQGFMCQEKPFFWQTISQ